MEKIEAVLFDLDDTLLDRKAAFRAVAEQLYDSQLSMQETHSREAAVSKLIHLDTFADRFDRILNSWPDIAASTLELETWYYEALGNNIKPDELALSLLADLNRASMPWGVVTNGGPFQHTKLRITGVRDLAPFVIVSADFGFEKPDLEIYVEALRKLGMPPSSSTLFVGDNPDTDIIGAQGAGMLTAWLRLGRDFPTHVPPAHYEVDHVDELRPLLFPYSP